MDSLEAIIKRNKLMVKLLWGISIVFIAFTATSGVDKSALYIVGPVLVGISLLSTIFILKGIFVEKMMYFVSFALSLIHFLFIFIFHDLNGFLFGFAILAMISLYQNYKVLLLTGILALSSLIYGFFTGGEKMFGNFNDPLGLIIVIVVFIMIITLMSVQSLNTEQIRRNVEKQKELAEKSSLNNQYIIEKLKDSISSLKDFSFNLKENINVTGEISKEVITAFNEVSTTFETQVNILTDINAAINNSNNYIKTVSEESNLMQDLSNKTLNITDTTEQNIDKFTEEIKKVVNNVDGAVLLTNDLNSQTLHIEDILETVNNISGQIHMIALNAKIEAARAGEYGRGFAVVANEVGNLANQSAQSTEQISNILVDIKNKVQKVSEQINVIHLSSNLSQTSVEEMANMFNTINSNSKSVAIKAIDVDKMTKSLEETSFDLLNRFNEILKFSEGTSSSVENVLVNASEQYKKIEDIEESFSVLENLVIELRKLSK